MRRLFPLMVNARLQIVVIRYDNRYTFKAMMTALTR